MNTSTPAANVDLCDFTRASIVRPGDAGDVDRLARLGGRILSRGIHRDLDGTRWPCVVMRWGRAQVVIVMCGADGISERQRPPPGGVASAWPVERGERKAEHHHKLMRGTPLIQRRARGMAPLVAVSRARTSRARENGP